MAGSPVSAPGRSGIVERKRYIRILFCLSGLMDDMDDADIANLLRYCMQNQRHQCKCGTCDGRCGPDDGCPCNDCAQLLVDEGKVLVMCAGVLAGPRGA